jgi:hypothetical protein
MRQRPAIEVVGVADKDRCDRADRTTVTVGAARRFEAVGIADTGYSADSAATDDQRTGGWSSRMGIAIKLTARVLTVAVTAAAGADATAEVGAGDCSTAEAQR